MWKSQVQEDRVLYLPRSRGWDWGTGLPGPRSQGGLALSVSSLGHSIQPSYSRESPVGMTRVHPHSLAKNEQLGKTA